MATNIERLKKLKELALRGVGGEREQAIKLLEKLSKKYNVSCDELDEEIIKEYDFEYHGKEQERILKQTIYKITNEKNSFWNLQYTYSGRHCKTRLRANCTEAQRIEIDFLFDFYKRIWEKEKEALLQAFFQKHRIFGELKEGEQGRELSREELLKMEALMRGLSDETPLAQITDGEKIRK